MTRHDSELPRSTALPLWLLPAAVAVALALGCDGTPQDAGSDADGDADADADQGSPDVEADAAGDAEADADDDPGTDADVDSDSAPDADEDRDADEPARIGKAGRSGSGIGTAEGYSGTERMFFIGDEGEGETICSITYELRSTGTAAGCDGCVWAFELVVGEAAVAEERDVGCEATLGIDPARVGDLNGDHVFYGYDPEYMSHGSVLVSRMESGAWAPECFASWDASSGAFSYERVDGYPPY